MTIEASQAITSGAAEALSGQPARPSRTLGRQAVIDTFARPGARLGLAWLLVLAFCAVFGPFLANTHPIAMKINGHWSSPLLRSLHPSDALLLLATLVTVVLSIGRWTTFLQGLGLSIVAMLIASPFAFYFVQPPINIDYTLWRTLASQGKIEAAMYAPVPHSPADRLRDDPEGRLQAP